MTQGQWNRLTGQWPNENDETVPVALVPVETVNGFEARLEPGVPGGRGCLITSEHGRFVSDRGVSKEEPMRVTLSVNGRAVTREVEPRLLLVYFLRDALGLKGTHVGCETSLCGACTVLVDGKALKSCTRLAVQCDGAAITTIEGLASAAAEGQGNGQLHPMQAAFREKHALQCGFCTPGMILTSVEIARQGAALDEEGVRAGLAGNLCRCTGYQHIVDAVLAVAHGESGEAAGGAR
jgi:carbon-monoxide dehydrogenase small subunit